MSVVRVKSGLQYVGGVQPPAETGFHHGNVDLGASEIIETPGRSRQFEKGQFLATAEFGPVAIDEGGITPRFR